MFLLYSLKALPTPHNLHELINMFFHSNILYHITTKSNIPFHTLPSKQYSSYSKNQLYFEHEHLPLLMHL